MLRLFKKHNSHNTAYIVSFLNLIIAAVLITIPGCRYPENDMISLKSKYKRLAGIWEITAYTVDGVDQLDALENAVSPCLGQLHFLHDGTLNMHSDLCVITGSYDFLDENYLALWPGFNNPSSRIDSSLTVPPFGNRYAFMEMYSWKMKKLTSFDFKFCSNFFGEEQCIYAVKVGEVMR